MPEQPDTWVAHDGTEYLVVAAATVGKFQRRWWLDKIPTHGDRMLGPSTPDRLHLEPASMIDEIVKHETDEAGAAFGVKWALVLPEETKQ